jgi:hypothetical protein
LEYFDEKISGLDRKVVFKNLLAYNKNQQLCTAEEVVKLIESNKDIKLLMVHNLTRYLKDSSGRKRVETASLLKQTTGMICKACGKNNAA